jgi:hypothetical protein
MMTKTKLLYARAGAAAIAAAVALPPTYAAPPQPTDASKPTSAPRPKPVVDLSKSPALSDKPAASPAAKPAAPAKRMIGPVDERTAEIGGGALAVLVLGGAAIAMSRRRRRRDEDEAAWQDTAEPEAHDPLFDEPMFHHEQPIAEAARAEPQPCDETSDDGSDRCPGESWVERAQRGPSPANPSASLKQRLSRAAFFDKREREVAAGQAEPVEPDAGLPEAMVEEQEREEA